MTRYQTQIDSNITIKELLLHAGELIAHFVVLLHTQFCRHLYANNNNNHDSLPIINTPQTHSNRIRFTSIPKHKLSIRTRCTYDL